MRSCVCIFVVGWAGVCVWCDEVYMVCTGVCECVCTVRVFCVFTPTSNMELRTLF